MANATSEHDDATFFLDGNELGPVSLVELYKSKKEGILWEGFRDLKWHAFHLRRKALPHLPRSRELSPNICQPPC